MRNTSWFWRQRISQCLLRFPVPPKQGTPPPVPPLGVKQPAEAPLPHNRKTVHVMNHLNEVLTGVPVHVWGKELISGQQRMRMVISICMMSGELKSENEDR